MRVVVVEGRSCGEPGVQAESGQCDVLLSPVCQKNLTGAVLFMVAEAHCHPTQSRQRRQQQSHFSLYYSRAHHHRHRPDTAALFARCEDGPGVRPRSVRLSELSRSALASPLTASSRPCRARLRVSGACDACRLPFVDDAGAGSPTLDARRLDLRPAAAAASAPPGAGALPLSAPRDSLPREAAGAGGSSSSSESNLNDTRRPRDLPRARSRRTLAGELATSVVGDDGAGDELAGGGVPDEYSGSNVYGYPWCDGVEYVEDDPASGI